MKTCLGTAARSPTSFRRYSRISSSVIFAPCFSSTIGHRDFTGMGVRTPHSGGHLDIRESIQRFFDYRRIDIMTPADNEFFPPSGEPEIAVLILSSQVPGIKPFRKGPDAFVVGLIQITLEDIRAFDTDLSDLIGFRFSRELALFIDR